MSDFQENNVQWYTGQKTVTASFTQKKFVTRFRKYLKNKVQGLQIVAQNKDGSICVRFPLSWVKISPPRKPREMTEEQRAAAVERLKLARQKKKEV